MVSRESAWRAALLAAALTLGSCSAHTTVASHSDQPPTGAQLRDRLLNAASLPAGVEVMLQATIDDHPETPSAEPDPCADIVDAHSLISLTHAPAATAHIALRTNETPLWSGSETLSSYPADGATKAIGEIRSLVQRCPTARAHPTPATSSPIPAPPRP